MDEFDILENASGTDSLFVIPTTTDVKKKTKKQKTENTSLENSDQPVRRRRKSKELSDKNDKPKEELDITTTTDNKLDELPFSLEIPDKPKTTKPDRPKSWRDFTDRKKFRKTKYRNITLMTSDEILEGMKNIDFNDIIYSSQPVSGKSIGINIIPKSYSMRDALVAEQNKKLGINENSIIEKPADVTIETEAGTYTEIREKFLDEVFDEQRKTIEEGQRRYLDLLDETETLRSTNKNLQEKIKEHNNTVTEKDAEINKLKQELEKLQAELLETKSSINKTENTTLVIENIKNNTATNQVQATYNITNNNTNNTATNHYKPDINVDMMQEQHERQRQAYLRYLQQQRNAGFNNGHDSWN